VHPPPPRASDAPQESFNPHVRYGATLAVGISCAATASADAIAVLEPMLTDPTDFVRQGAFISLALVLSQTTQAQCPFVSKFRAAIDKAVADKHEDPLAKFGAIVAAGLLDFAGRNAVVTLVGHAGVVRASAAVGVAMFLQYWYWFPFAHFISLAASPTCLTCVNGDLKLPVFEFVSNAKPSLFAYPPPLKVAAKEAPTKVAVAVLSTTHRNRLRHKRADAPTDMAVVAWGGGGV
jgi:26S proteasome regulatory subunit N2